MATAPAGCQPVRVAVSPNGAVVWVSARGSNRLLAFSATRLRARPAQSLLASVRVWAAPVGITVLSTGSRVVVADSNRFGPPGQRGRLTVVDTKAALAHRPALLGSIQAGRFPRELAVVPGRQLVLVTDFGSNRLQVVDTSRLPDG